MTETGTSAKAVSVTEMGIPDGYVPPLGYQGQILEGGHTRIEVSSGTKELAQIHIRLVESFTFPCKVRYVKLTDRQEGQYQKPKSYVAVNVGREIILEALTHLQELIYHDGRHQLWILGLQGEQIVLDELGMVYLYPDDFRFRDVLEDLGITEKSSSDNSFQTMSQRDYVMVNFSQQADAQEVTLLQSIGFIPDTHL